MFSKDGCLLLPGSSASLLPFSNNLSVHRSLQTSIQGQCPDGQASELILRAAVVHKSTVNIVKWVADDCGKHKGLDQQIRARVQCCNGGSTGDKAFVLQTMWIASRDDPKSVYLVVATTQAIQIHEEDGRELCSWSPEKKAEGIGPRVFAALSHGRKLAVGMQNGVIHLLSVEGRGTLMPVDAINTSAVADTVAGVSALVGDGGSERFASGNDNGHVLVYDQDSAHRPTQSFEGRGFPCTGIAFWKDTVVVAYGSGHLRLFDVVAGRILAEVTAHVCWITGLDVAEDEGVVLSTSEDSFVRVWQLSPPSSDPQDSPISLKYSECISDVRLCGGRFLRPDGRKFALTGYEQEEIMCYST